MRVELCTLSLSRHVPLALGFLKAYAIADPELKERWDMRITDLRRGDDRSTWLNAILAEPPDIVCFSCYVWNIVETLELVSRIKEAHPNVFVLLGGPEAAPRADELTAQYADGVAIGEGEGVFADVLKAFLHKGGDVSGIAGLTHRGARGVIRGISREPIARLDSVPSPYRPDILDVSDGRIPCLETHRGCGFACHFCFYHKSYGPSRYFSKERVREELKRLTEASPCELIYLMDPTFNENRAHAKDVCRLIIEGGYKRNFHAEVRADLLDEELAALMKRANVAYLEIGLQSATGSALDEVQRGGNRKRFIEGMRLLNAYEFNYVLHLIFGLPEETFEDFLKSVRCAIGFRPPVLQIFLLELLPGTGLRERSEELGIRFRREPFYLMTENKQLSEADVIRGRWVSAAVDLFYNQMPRTAARLLDGSGEDIVDLALALSDWVHAEGRQRYAPEDYFAVLSEDAAVEFTGLKASARGFDAEEIMREARAEIIRPTLYNDLFNPQNLPASSSREAVSVGG